MTEYIKKSDVINILAGYHSSYIKINNLPVYTFPDAVKEPSIREMVGKVIKSTPLGGMNSINTVDFVMLEAILNRIVSKLEELEKR